MLGGGVNHYELLRQWAGSTGDDRHIIFVSSTRRLFDQELLPKYLMKLLPLEKCQLDLWKACQRAGIDFLEDRVIRLDRDAKIVELEKNGHLPYDELSIECAAEAMYPRMGSRDHDYILPSRPHDNFVKSIDAFMQEVHRHSPRDLRVVLSGGHFSIVELALTLQGLLQPLCQRSEVVIFTQEQEILTDLAKMQRKSLLHFLKTQNIRVLCEKSVDRIENHILHFTDGVELELDVFIPSEHFRPKDLYTRLLSDNSQSLLVNQSLQYVKDPSIYIHGDCVQWASEKTPMIFSDKKEQQRVLGQNLALPHPKGRKATYRPQLRKLDELPLDSHRKLRFMGPFVKEVPWDRHDWRLEMNRALAQKREVPIHKERRSQLESMESYEAGHARRPWESTRSFRKEDEQGQLRLVSTVGYNWWGDFGLSCEYLTQVALAKSLCQGLIPESLRLSLVIPESEDVRWSQHLFQTSIRAVERVLKQEGVFFAGGDTLTGPHWSLALTVAGQQMPNMAQNFRPGDYLIVTRPLGFGLLWSGRYLEKFKSQWFEKAMAYPVSPGILALSEFFQNFDVRGAVVVEEWGFLYHCMQALAGDQQLVVNFRKVPKWDGIDTVLKSSVSLPTVNSNWERVADEVNFDRDRLSKTNSILWDSRSHGSMVLGVRPENWKTALASLQEMGFTDASLMGCIRPQKTAKRVVLSDWLPEEPVKGKNNNELQL